MFDTYLDAWAFVANLPTSDLWYYAVVPCAFDSRGVSVVAFPLTAQGVVVT